MVPRGSEHQGEEAPRRSEMTDCVKQIEYFFVADGINSVGDYNFSPSGCRLCVCVCVSVCLSPLFFTFHDGITSKRFELLS